MLDLLWRTSFRWKLLIISCVVQVRLLDDAYGV
jgi:hypothetical protein